MPRRRAPSGGSKQGPSCLSQLLRTPGVQAPLGLGPRRPVPACGHTATPFVFLCLPLPSGASAQSWAPAGDIPTGSGLGGCPRQPRLLPRQAHMRTGRYGTRPAHACSRWPPRGRSASRSRAERAWPARRTPWNPGARAPAWADEKLAGLDGGGGCTRLRRRSVPTSCALRKTAMAALFKHEDGKSNRLSACRDLVLGAPLSPTEEQCQGRAWGRGDRALASTRNEPAALRQRPGAGGKARPSPVPAPGSSTCAGPRGLRKFQGPGCSSSRECPRSGGI